MEDDANGLPFDSAQVDVYAKGQDGSSVTVQQRSDADVGVATTGIPQSLENRPIRKKGFPLLQFV